MGPALHKGRRQASRKRQGLPEEQQLLQRQAQGHRAATAPPRARMSLEELLKDRVPAQRSGKPVQIAGVHAPQEQQIGVRFSRGAAGALGRRAAFQHLDSAGKRRRQRPPGGWQSRRPQGYHPALWAPVLGGITPVLGSPVGAGAGSSGFRWELHHFITWQPWSKYRNYLVYKMGENHGGGLTGFGEECRRSSIKES